MAYTHAFDPTYSPNAAIVAKRIDDGEVGEHTLDGDGVVVDWLLPSDKVKVTLDSEATGDDLAALAAIVDEPVTLAWMKSQKLNALDECVQNYRYGRYWAGCCLHFTGLYVEAVDQSLTNRAAYVRALFTWISSQSTGYRATKAAAVAAASNKAELDAVSFSVADMAAIYDATDPAVTIAGALAIED